MFNKQKWEWTTGSKNKNANEQIYSQMLWCTAIGKRFEYESSASQNDLVGVEWPGDGMTDRVTSSDLATYVTFLWSNVKHNRFCETFLLFAFR